jgi:hypothetical protein
LLSTNAARTATFWTLFDLTDDTAAEYAEEMSYKVRRLLITPLPLSSIPPPPPPHPPPPITSFLPPLLHYLYPLSSQHSILNTQPIASSILTPLLLYPLNSQHSTLDLMIPFSPRPHLPRLCAQDITHHWESFDTSVDAFAAFFSQMLPMLGRALGGAVQVELNAADP